MTKTAINKLNRSKTYEVTKFLNENRGELENMSLPAVAKLVSERLLFEVKGSNIKSICKAMGDDAPKLKSNNREGDISNSGVAAGLARIRKAIRIIAENLDDKLAKQVNDALVGRKTNGEE